MVRRSHFLRRPWERCRPSFFAGELERPSPKARRPQTVPIRALGLAHLSVIVTTHPLPHPFLLPRPWLTCLFPYFRQLMMKRRQHKWRTSKEGRTMPKGGCSKTPQSDDFSLSNNMVEKQTGKKVTSLFHVFSTGLNFVGRTFFTRSPHPRTSPHLTAPFTCPPACLWATWALQFPARFSTDLVVGMLRSLTTGFS